MSASNELEALPLMHLRGAFSDPRQGLAMQHPTTLPLPQQQQISRAIRKCSIHGVARALGITREAVVKLAKGMPARPGTVALAQVALPALDAALAGREPPRAA